MTVTTPRDFFTHTISVTSSTMPEEFRLTRMEINFLVECCMFNYEGSDVSNLKDLTKYLLDKKFFVRKRDVSLYKYKISLKKWAETSRTEFILPAQLNKKEGDELEYSFSISYKKPLDEVSDR